MNNRTIQKLMEFKERIEINRSMREKAEGRREQLIKQLKEDFNCSSTIAAERKIRKYEEQVNKIQAQIDSGLKDLEENYDWT